MSITHEKPPALSAEVSGIYQGMDSQSGNFPMESILKPAPSHSIPWYSMKAFLGQLGQYVNSSPLQLKSFQIKAIMQKAAKWEINNM